MNAKRPTSRSQAPDEIEVQGDEVDIQVAFRRSLWVILGLVAVILVGIGIARLIPQPKVEERAGELAAPTLRDIKEVEIPKVTFTQVTDEAGITFEHVNGAQGLKLLPETMGGGVAWFDYDNDEDFDLLLINSTYWPGEQPETAAAPRSQLFQNQGDGSFVDVTDAAELDLEMYGMGCAIGDYDGDGWRDVFVTAVGGNRLLRNVEGKFVDVTESAGVAGLPDEWSTSSGWLDYDRDGDLDLFVCNYVRWNRELNIQLKPTLDGKTRAYAPPTQFEGRFPYLYRNEGDGTFQDVAEAAGMHVKNPDTGVPVPKSLGIAFADFNQDGWLDIVVANDTVPNLLFQNNHDGTFSEIGQLVGIAFDSQGIARGAMGTDIAYHRNDDSLSIAIGNFSDEPTSLYVSQGQPLFTDESMSTGLGPQTREELTFGVLWFDYDLDGRLDFLAANGHLENEIEKIRQRQRYEQPPHLFWNAGFDQINEFVSVDAAHAGDDLVRPLVGRGSAYADYDGDGDQDVILTTVDGQPRLLRNDQQLGHHWLRVSLRQPGKNWEALGAVLRLEVDGEVMTRVLSPTRSYLSQSEPVATFGLGDRDRVDALKIQWPDGETQTVSVDKIDQWLVVERQP